MVKEIKRSDVVTFDLLYEDYLKKVIGYLEDKDCWRIEEKNLNMLMVIPVISSTNLKIYKK